MFPSTNLPEMSPTSKLVPHTKPASVLSRDDPHQAHRRPNLLEMSPTPNLSKMTNTATQISRQGTRVWVPDLGDQVPICLPSSFLQHFVVTSDLGCSRHRREKQIAVSRSVLVANHQIIIEISIVQSMEKISDSSQICATNARNVGAPKIWHESNASCSGKLIWWLPNRRQQ